LRLNFNRVVINYNVRRERILEFMPRCYSSLIALTSLISRKTIPFLIITYFMVFSVSLTQSVPAGEGSILTLFNKDHSSSMLDPRFFEHEHLLDSKPRDILEDKGLSLDMIFTSDFVTNHTGGLKEAGSDIDTHISYLANIDLCADLDTEKAGLWSGGTFHTHFFNHHGAKPSEDYIGDLQTVDNLETNKVTKLYELWYEHTFDLYDTDLSLLIGQHDLNSEFMITDYGLLFVHSSFGIQPDISNNIPVSNYPVAALGLRMKWEPTENLYFMVEISDGDPGKNNGGFDWKLDSKEGFLNFFEAGYHFGDKHESSTMPGTYKFGWWYHTDEFADIRDMDENGDPLEHNGNYGLYFIADQMLIPGKGKGGLGAFIHVGGVPEDRNKVDFYIGGGFHYQGIIPSRENDILGLAAARASISGDFKDIEKSDSHETAVELTYRAQVLPWLAIQPGVQTIFNPGADSSLDNGIISILRFQINL